jgi:lysophospholipase L1-like esterase
MGPFTFHMPTWEEVVLSNEVEYADVSSIIEQQFDIDSLVNIERDTINNDTIIDVVKGASYDALVQSVYKIELTDTGKQNLYRFFNSLKNDSIVRIMHYGDSQIEGDRITAFIRNKLQLRFGGTGVGLRPALQPYDYIFSAVQQNSDNWKRYPVYGAVDSLVTHNKYGVMGAFSRYAPLTSDSVPYVDSALYEANLTIEKSKISYKTAKAYKNMRLFYGNTKRPVDLEVLANGKTVLKNTLRPDIEYGVIECDLPDTTYKIELRFLGFDGPDIYGIELAEKTGIIVDNIALRGSSGTIFTRTDFVHSKKMYDDLDPQLFILQFGGNVMPYITDTEAIKRYGSWFGSQLKRIQKMCPDAAIIVIGPSDMSTKEKDKFVTYPHLPEVVEELKITALESGCAYWDMFGAMGGKNSMPAWVNAEPELARPDYVHFSPRGARVIANMFYNALIVEYNNYLEGGN